MEIGYEKSFNDLFRGSFDVCASDINEQMKIAAAKAIAKYVKDSELNEGHIIPSVLDRSVAAQVANVVAKAAVVSGVSRKTD